MGCCSSSRRAGSVRSPVYLYCPRTFECGPTASPVSLGILFDPDIDTSIPDTYRAPPAPLPYDLGLSFLRTAPSGFGNAVNKTNIIRHGDARSHLDTNSDGAFGISDAYGNSKILDCKSKSENIESLKVISEEDEHLKPTEFTPPALEEDDVCPICLEEYDLENPRSVTKCDHHFHFSCILEWMERSDTCPMCEVITAFCDALD